MAKIKENAETLITDYIQGLPPFSKEICLALREIFLSASLDLVEDWKWGPNYNCNGMVAGYGGFQKHVKVTFFRGNELKDKDGLFNHCLENQALRSIKYTSVDEIDAKKLKALVQEAVKLNKKASPKKLEKIQNTIPPALEDLLKRNEKAKEHFDGMSAYKQKEFIEQVETAKRAETLITRLEKIERLLEANIGWNDKYRDAQKS